LTDAAVLLFGQVGPTGWQVRRIRETPPLFLTYLQLLVFVFVELALVSEPSADSVVWFPAQAVQKIVNTARMTKFFNAIFPWFGGKKNSVRLSSFAQSERNTMQKDRVRQLAISTDPSAK
jgi:hypothetical protein